MLMKSSSKQFNHVNCNQSVDTPVLFEARPNGQSRVTLTQAMIIRNQISLIRQQKNTALIRKLTRRQSKLNSQRGEFGPAKMKLKAMSQKAFHKRASSG